MYTLDLFSLSFKYTMEPETKQAFQNVVLHEGQNTVVTKDEVTSWFLVGNEQKVPLYFSRLSQLDSDIEYVWVNEEDIGNVKKAFAFGARAAAAKIKSLFPPTYYFDALIAFCGAQLKASSNPENKLLSRALQYLTLAKQRFILGASKSPYEFYGDILRFHKRNKTGEIFESIEKFNVLYWKLIDSLELHHATIVSE